MKNVFVGEVQLDKKERRYKILGLCLIVLFFLFFCFMSLKDQAQVRGDGYEYIAQVEAWINHQSMDFREEDYLSIRSDHGENLELTTRNWLQYTDRHKYIANNGKQYAPHFGGYALVVVPGKMLFKALGITPVKSFPATNTMMYTMALMVIFFCAKISFEKKFYLMLLLVFNPAVFYISWVHTEIFSFAFAVIGLVFFYNKRHKTSILFISIAAMQNVSLMFLGMAVGLDYWREIIQKSKQYDVSGKLMGKQTTIQMFKDYKFDIMRAGMCYLPGLLPVIHTMINFGKINLVASVAMENKYLLQKTWAYWTDLNLGIFPYVPLIVIIFIVQIILVIRKKIWYVFLHILSIGGIYFIVSHQIQINSDMEGIMRYNVWVIPILIFFIIYNGDIFSWSSFFKKTLTASAAITMVVICLAMGLFHGNRRTFVPLDFAPWTEIILKYVPRLYNPYQGIFISRTVHREQYGSSIPIVYKDSEGYIRKILMPRTKDLGLQIIGSDEDKDYLADCINSLKDKEYQYISIPYSKKLKAYKLLNEFDSQTIDVKDTTYILDGIYESEGDYCWIQPDVMIGLNADAFDGSDLRLTYMFPDIIKNNIDTDDCSLDIFVNGVLVRQVDLNQISTTEYQEVIIPAADLTRGDDGLMVLELKTNVSVIPFEKKWSIDKRILSLRLQYVGAE